MGEIRFDTGVRTYDLNGACEVRFNPTDLDFAERLCDVFAQLEQRGADRAATGDAGAVFARGRALDAEMRELIDGLFSAPVCQALFGGMNVYAMAGGLPVWCNLLLAVMDEIREAVAAESAEISPRIAAYTAKYRR